MPALLGWLIEIVGTLVGKVLISLGISYLSYQGLDVMVTAGKAAFFSNVQGLGGVTIAVMGLLKIDVAINMVCSAIVGRLVLAGMTSGAIKRMVLK